MDWKFVTSVLIPVIFLCFGSTWWLFCAFFGDDVAVGLPIELPDESREVLRVEESDDWLWLMSYGTNEWFELGDGMMYSNMMHYQVWHKWNLITQRISHVTTDHIRHKPQLFGSSDKVLNRLHKGILLDLFGYVTKNSPRLSPGNHSFYR